MSQMNHPMKYLRNHQNLQSFHLLDPILVDKFVLAVSFSLLEVFVISLVCFDVLKTSQTRTDLEMVTTQFINLHKFTSTQFLKQIGQTFQ